MFYEQETVVEEQNFGGREEFVEDTTTVEETEQVNYEVTNCGVVEEEVVEETTYQDTEVVVDY